MLKNLLPVISRRLSALLITLFMSAAAFAQNWKLVQPAFPTADAFVAAYSVKDDGATGDGVTDVTSIFQSRLNALGNLGGGTLFVPGGRYVIRGALVIPRGVTLRGEWKKPVKGQPITGTILMAYTGRGDESAASFITMEPTAGVQDLAIWYPEQMPDNITPYSPAITFGRPNYWGNEFCNARNITLVNTYSGVVFSRINGGSCPVINGLYGTPLSRGFEIDNIADVGHMENIDFSPAYWAGSGLPDAPAAGSGYAGWIHANGTGIVMRRNDWSYTSFVNIEGYKIGFHAAPSVASPGAIPNGHNYGMTFTNCSTGIYCEGVSNVGIMFARVNTIGCTNGIVVGSNNTDGALQLHTCNINGSTNAISTAPGCMARIMAQQCTFGGGKVDIAGGTLMASDCDFNNSAPQITLGERSRGVITGNRFRNTVKIVDKTPYINVIDHTPLALPKLPAFPAPAARTQQPSRKALYVATAPPFNAKNDGVTDNTSAVQNALDQASAEGGGIVFLPPGKYKFLGHLSIPRGVELKGATDNLAAPMGQGTILEPYADKNNPAGTAFIRLAPSSGMRGLTINYPEQVYANLPNVPAYPYTIQVTGSDVYIVNVGLRAAYNGVDLFTNKCDNHYIEGLTGHVFRTAVKVGAGATGGLISNAQLNTIVYAAGAESKWGSWPNSPVGENSKAYDYNFNNLDFLALGNCAGEVLYNNFIYGARHGIAFLQDGGNGPSGISLGTGLDGTRNAISFQGLGAGGFDLINSQLVAVGDTTYSYIESTPAFTATVTLYNADFWGNPGKSLDLSGAGTLRFQSANFHQPGQMRFATIKAGALSIHNSAVWPVNTVLSTGSEPRFSAQSSIVDSNNIRPGRAALWKNNAANAWSVSVEGAMDRQGWTATASVNPHLAQNALDSATTTWTTTGPQTAGQSFTVDMKTVNTIRAVVLDCTLNPNDSPAGYDLFVSMDGVNWGSAVASGTGTTGMTLINFPEQVGRYIHVVQTGSRDWWWTIQELYAFGRVNVAGISLDTTSKKLPAGATHKLTATILPLNATVKTITWSSSNTGVARVDPTGMVTAIAPGNAIITVTTSDGGKAATCADTITANGNTPFGGTPAAIPGKIEAENYDDGGPGIAYSDADAINNGIYRPTEGVDAENCGEGTYNVGWTSAGEWLKYTVDIHTAGVYALQVRIASPYTGKRLHIELDGVNISGTLNVPNTGSWQTYQTITVTTPSLSTGRKTLRLVMDTDGFNINYLDFISNAAAESITVYPNPLTGNQLNLQLNGHQPGRYRVLLFNSLNQPVLNTTINAGNGNGTYALPLRRKLTPGYYVLEMTDTKGKRTVKKIVVQ